MESQPPEGQQAGLWEHRHPGVSKTKAGTLASGGSLWAWAFPGELSMPGCARGFPRTFCKEGDHGERLGHSQPFLCLVALLSMGCVVGMTQSHDLKQDSFLYVGGAHRGLSSPDLRAWGRVGAV